MHNKKLLLLLLVAGDDDGLLLLGWVLDAGRWWYGWVLHWDVVQAGCCIDRTGMMIRWGCAEKNVVPLRSTKWNHSDLTVKSVKDFVVRHYTDFRILLQLRKFIHNFKKKGGGRDLGARKAIDVFFL